MNRIACWIGLILLTCTAPAAQAASFDCAKAGTPTEKAICRDPEVSRLDEQVGAAFKAVQVLWPGEGWKSFVRADQREWLRVRNTECKAEVACLKRDYEIRLTFLTRPGFKYTGRYIAGPCPKDGVYLDATPEYPAEGLAVDIYLCPDPAGNMLLQARGTIDAAGLFTFTDVGCTLTMQFSEGGVTFAAPKTGKCAPLTEARVFKRDFARSPYALEQR